MLLSEDSEWVLGSSCPGASLEPQEGMEEHRLLFLSICIASARLAIAEKTMRAVSGCAVGGSEDLPK